ncbi:DNA polymerase III subunit beta [Bacillus sp. FJAT-27225]|uniref:DNA polymerase III subunit beta n=1 Tax=Bacillus sp. FJAT-27225 TaxID=1743144 RepID=UPI00080C2985|nr:DNA polymerase III subunit beta [Bacillus sp. FJAT-27225]OCA81655.1 DNA polymerase III subunit beta [Bacillus sp. FJAT-27225]
MEFVIQNESFNRAIADVTRAVSSRTPFPILTGIKLVATSDGLILIGSNSDMIIEKIVPVHIDGENAVKIVEPGSVVVSAKYLNEIIKKMPGDVHVRVNEKQVVTIKSGDIVTRLNGFHSEEYPNLPHIVEAMNMEVPCYDLIEMIKQTAFAASKTETRPILTAVNMSFAENRLSCAATNSHRLAIRSLSLKSDVRGSFNVPSSSLTELIKLFNNERNQITIFLTDNYIVFKTKTVSLYSRLIEGKYPEVSALLPKECKTEIILGTSDFLKGIDRACLFASEWKNNNVNLEITDDRKLRISSNSSEIGKIEETQRINVLQGEPNLSISLDGSFLMDALKVIKEDEIKVSFSGTMRPVVIEPVGNPDYLHLISPVRSY